MKLQVLTKDDFVTTEWTGGTTTQIGIFPETAIYADRDFTFRISSATVDDETSTFTPLPDYSRLITVLEGNMKLKIGDFPAKEIRRGIFTAFDGASHVISEGRCRDFNVMMRKGICTGTAEMIRGDRGKSRSITIPSNTDFFILFAVTGEIGIKAGKHDIRVPRSGALVISSPDIPSVELLSAKHPPEAIAVAIHSVN